MLKHYYQPATLEDALRLLDQQAGKARIVAGGTDVLVELSRGVRPTTTLIDITRIAELHYIRQKSGSIRLGALTTHNDVVASEECVRYALPLAQACWEVGAPQIRTRATVAGNLVTASPANDTIAPLIALNAEVVLTSVHGERIVPLSEFYPGFRRTVLQPNELLREIRIPALQENQRGLFIKLGLRRAQAISVIDLAIVLTFDHQDSSGPINDARISLGCLAPTIVRAPSAEAFLKGRRLDPDVCATAGKLACQDAAPIDDVRGTAWYRMETLANLLAEGLQWIAEGRERENWPAQPVLLETAHPAITPSTNPLIESVATRINGLPATLDPTRTLLDAIRENAGLTGTKEGCAEGECGACTVWLNGQAVMACLTPAAQAQGASITTIEGLAESANNRHGALHPLQQAFIEHGSVQCGYCIPGFLMAGAKLLEEHRTPSPEQVRVALSGNICRCTGYRKILDAMLAASDTGAS